MARRGTEVFPDLGAHCDEAECNQLDECDGFFCAAHRVYRDHGCAKAADQGRTVVVCPDCGDAIERTVPGQCDREILDARRAAATRRGAKRAGTATAGCGRHVQKKKQGGCRPALAVSARSFKIC